MSTKQDKEKSIHLLLILGKPQNTKYAVMNRTYKGTTFIWKVDFSPAKQQQEDSGKNSFIELSEKKKSSLEIHLGKDWEVPIHGMRLNEIF